MDETLAIGVKLCTVLDYLHTRRPPIIFRDLKPANIMLTPDERVVLIDFGIARHFKPGQIRDTVTFGSPGYAPPEQYGKGQTTPRADIYSLGATLHQMLSGYDPADSPFRFRPLHLPAYTAPAGLNTFIMHMVELDECNRPISMAAVKQTLQGFVAQWTTRQANSVQPSRSSGLFLPAQQAGRAAGKSWFRSGTSKQRSAPAPPVAVAAAWSPDSKQIASCGHDQTVQVWQTG